MEALADWLVAGSLEYGSALIASHTDQSASHHFQRTTYPNISETQPKTGITLAVREPRIFLQEVNNRLSMSGDGLQRLQQRFCLAIKAVDIINDLCAQPLLLRDWAFSEEHCHLTA